MSPLERSPFDLRSAPTLADCRKFGVTLLIGLPLAGLFWFCLLRVTSGLWRPGVPLAFSAVAAVGAAIALFPRWGRHPYIAWHAVTRGVELVGSAILLFVVFHGVVAPLGAIRRRRSSRFRRAGSGTAQSYWQDVPRETVAAQYYRQF